MDEETLDTSAFSLTPLKTAAGPKNCFFILGSERMLPWRRKK
jgi:hypothetical protein